MALSRPEIFLNSLIYSLNCYRISHTTNPSWHQISSRFFDSWARLPRPIPQMGHCPRPRKIITNFIHQFPHIPVIGFQREHHFYMQNTPDKRNSSLLVWDWIHRFHQNTQQKPSNNLPYPKEILIQ